MSTQVLSATELMMRIHPQRLFYLTGGFFLLFPLNASQRSFTGHSLGGGVAKLVALKLSRLAHTLAALKLSLNIRNDNISTIIHIYIYYISIIYIISWIISFLTIYSHSLVHCPLLHFEFLLHYSLR